LADSLATDSQASPMKRSATTPIYLGAPMADGNERALSKIAWKKNTT
jgi:hypothetical protein